MCADFDLHFRIIMQITFAFYGKLTSILLQTLYIPGGSIPLGHSLVALLSPTGKLHSLVDVVKASEVMYMGRGPISNRIPLVDTEGLCTL